MWPMSEGYFNAAVLLSPGSNKVQLQRHHNGDVKASRTLNLTYILLLEPPRYTVLLWLQ